MSHRILMAFLNSRGEGVILGRLSGVSPAGSGGGASETERPIRAEAADEESLLRSIHARARESGAETRWSEGPGQGEASRSRAVDFILLGMENY